MRALILAAGLGTRLRPLTNTVPKPMVNLGGRPCMEYTVRLLAQYGVNEIMVNLHYLPEPIKNHFGDGSAYGVNISYSYEEELMGTAGGLKRVQDFFADQTVLVISGDALTDINLSKFYRFHQKQQGLATLAIKRVADPTQYGVVHMEDNQILHFQEKPSHEEAISNLANTGIYLFEPGIFAHIPANTFYDFGKQVFPDLLTKNHRISGYPMQDYWCDVGTLDVYREAHYDLLTGIVRAELPGKRLEGNIWLGERISIHPETVIVGPVVMGKNCTIEAGARIYGPAIMGDQTVIGKNVVLKRCILWDNVHIEDNAEISDSIISSDCLIPANILIKHTVLEKSNLKAYCEAAITKE